jgi:heme oxygenase
MIEARNSVMQRLKTETRDLHTHAETRALQRAIAAGEVARTTFSAYLGQLYHVHRSLESALENSRGTIPIVAALATGDRMRVPDLERDLAFFGVNRDELAAGESARRFSEQIEQTRKTDPVALLGALYVLEGSTNGGRFLARALRKSWDLDGEGLSYFDPYGDEQPQKWAAFKQQMDDASLEAGQEDAIVEMAKVTFHAIADVSDEVSAGRR